MQKEQSKPIESLSFQELFQMGQEKYEELDYEQAEYFYGLAYNKCPFNQAVVMVYANLLKQNEKTKQAKKILEKSIKENPNGTYKRYFELGQIYNGVEAIKAFQAGIAQAHKNLKNPFKTVTPQAQIKRDIAQAYASVAQICMTDLIDQPQAQAKCTQALQKGVKTDPKCMDVHLQNANYQLFKQNQQAARHQLDIILSGVRTKQQEYQNQLILQAAKYYIQLDEFLKSSQLLQTIHQEESNQSEVVYLLAYCAFKSHKYDDCQDYIEEYQEGVNNIKDEEVQEAMKQLIVELKKIRKNQNKHNKNQEMGQTGEEQADLEDQEEWMDVEDQNN